MEKEIEEWINFRTKATSEMLDNPTSAGIYPTSKFYQALDEYFLSIVQPIQSSLTDLQFKNAELESALQAEKLAHGLTQAALEELDKEVQRLKDLKA